LNHSDIIALKVRQPIAELCRLVLTCGTIGAVVPFVITEKVMSQLSMIDRGAEILVRTIRPEEGNLSIEAARAILTFQLSPSDRERVNELAARARAGTLISEERAELDEYERIACLLELMQSKARLSLKQAEQSL
jgi:hypothetical protein